MSIYLAIVATLILATLLLYGIILVFQLDQIFRVLLIVFRDKLKNLEDSLD